MGAASSDPQGDEAPTHWQPASVMPPASLTPIEAWAIVGSAQTAAVQSVCTGSCAEVGGGWWVTLFGQWVKAARENHLQRLAGVGPGQSRNRRGSPMPDRRGPHSRRPPGGTEPLPLSRSGIIGACVGCVAVPAPGAVPATPAGRVCGDVGGGGGVRNDNRPLHKVHRNKCWRIIGPAMPNRSARCHLERGTVVKMRRAAHSHPRPLFSSTPSRLEKYIPYNPSALESNAVASALVAGVGRVPHPKHTHPRACAHETHAAIAAFWW